jgi:type IV pilus assembly protein PilB
MVEFDNIGQSKKIKEIHNKEEERFVENLATEYGIPYAILTTINVEADALVLVSEDEARKAFLAPFKLASNILYVGVKSFNLPETEKILERFSEQYTLQVYLVSSKSLESAWSLYKDISHTRVTQDGMLDLSGDRLVELSEQFTGNNEITSFIQRLLESQESQKTTHLMEAIFAGAIATEASDVHIESQENIVRVRFRQDGVLQDIVYIDKESYAKILSRIKLLSEMKITLTANAQDGRFTIRFKETEIEVRVSVVPGAYGESFVMRLLNPESIQVGLESLGIEPKLYEILSRQIRKPNGMILTTGPTGSGKTTTLYSFMNKVYNPEIKIITIEDPIEYHLTGVSQTQVNPEKGYTFLSGLRAALRQDPDVVMVGEIRDAETASIAVNASLTGHLVLSTLHTNSAAGVIPRLIDLQVSPQILAAALSVSLAQRLVRKICDHCRYEVEPSDYENETLKKIINEALHNEKPFHEYGVYENTQIRLFAGRGCEYCNQTGYKGRVGIFEAIITDEKIEALLNSKPSEQEVRRVAEQQGLLNMREDALVKIINGVTTFAEVEKVIDLEIIEFTKNRSEKNIQTETPPPLIDTKDKQLNPGALLGGPTIEIAILQDYLKRLEYDQQINPENNIQGDVQKVKELIQNLLGNQSSLEDTHKNALKEALERTEHLHEDQQDNPEADASKKIRSLREHLQAALPPHTELS